jgi:hypothetical protein
VCCPCADRLHDDGFAFHPNSFLLTNTGEFGGSHGDEDGGVFVLGSDTV